MNSILGDVHHRAFDWCADFLFTERKQSHKWVSNLTGAEITEKGVSHFGRLILLGIAAVVGAVLAKFWLDVYVALTSPAGPVQTFVLGSAALVVGPVTLFYTWGVPKVIFGFFKKTCCEHCGTYTRYPHDLSRAIPDTFPTESESHDFCSRECREAWERGNMDYERESWYSLQSEREGRHRNAIAEREYLEGR